MITLHLTEQDFQALAGLIDAGIRATGMGAVKDAARLLAKMEEAVAEAKAPKADNVVKMDAAE